jgi:Predicted dehydrogenases and related proteins
MPRKIYNISIAGCGKVAHLHARAIQNIPDAHLAGVWSRTFSTAEGFATRYKTRPYSDIGQMVVENDVDLVIVCTPHPFQGNLLLKLLRQVPVFWSKSLWHPAFRIAMIL